MSAVPCADLLAALEAVARAHPARIAVEGPERDEVSYAALIEASRARAGVLQDAGLGAGERVLVVRSRSPALVVELLACWRVGAAPVLVDPGSPQRRRAEIEAAARPRLVSTDDGLRPGAALPAHDPGVAYVVFTSGSSGAPKGVRVGPAGLVPLFTAQIAAFALRPGARSLAWLSPGFDAFLSDLGCALLAGATLVMARDAERASVEATRRAVAQRAITHLDYPPALLRALEPAAWPATLEVLVVGGEACAPATLADHAAARRVVNVYGPTEATICTSLGVVDARTWDAPRLGEPLPHVRYRVAVDGELWIAGPGLALGYLDAPAEDRRAFVVEDGTRWYRSGDRVRDDGGAGGLLFAGRLDRQVKVGGVRLELGEIERRLEARAGVRSAAVTQREDGVLVAFVEGEGWEPEALRAGLAAVLPSVAVPRWILPVGASLPRSLNGKIASDQLASSALAAVVEEVLGHSIDRARGFRDNGGDSLAAVHIAAVAQARGLSVEPAALEGAATLEAVLPADGVRYHRADAFTVVAVPARGPRRTPSPDGATLVIGAAGFLGRHLLRAALVRDVGPLVAWVRASDDEAARVRLEAALGGVLPSTVRVVCSGAGLSDTPLTRVYACAGRVAAAAAAHDNLAAIGDALGVAAAHGARLILASSLAPFVARREPAGVVEEDAVLPADAQVAGAYAAAKWAGEAAVRASGLDAVVVRLGLLVGDSVGGLSHARCQLSLFVRGLAAVGMAPALDADPLAPASSLDPEPRVDLTPVDVAAAALLELGRTAPVGTYHVASETGVGYRALVEALAAHRPLVRTDADRFEAAAHARLAAAPAIAVALAGLERRLRGDLSARAVAADLFLTTGARFSRTRALAVLGPDRLPRIDDALVARLVGRALAEDT